MRILFLIDTLEIGGAEKSLLEMLPRFEHVEPILCHVYPGSTLEPAFDRAGIRVVSLGVRGKYSFIDAVQRLRGVIRSEQPALIHATLFRSDVIGRVAGAIERVPVINTFVSDSYSANRQALMSPARLFKHRALQVADWTTARLALRFVANSGSIKKSNCRALGITPQKVDVIYRGRDLKNFPAANSELRAAGRQALGLAPEQRMILNVGRVLQAKGQDDLIRAMPLIRRHHPQAHLFIAGDGPFRPTLEKLTANLGLTDCVTLLGERHDIPQLLQSTDLFVSPSHYEGLPGAVVEAMLTALPIALSDINVHREMAIENVTARLFPLKDIAAIAESACSFLGAPEEAARIGAEARSRAEQLFNIENVVDQHERLYAKLLHGMTAR